MIMTFFTVAGSSPCNGVATVLWVLAEFNLSRIDFNWDCKLTTSLCKTWFFFFKGSSEEGEEEVGAAGLTCAEDDGCCWFEGLTGVSFDVPTTFSLSMTWSWILAWGWVLASVGRVSFSWAAGTGSWWMSSGSVGTPDLISGRVRDGQRLVEFFYFGEFWKYEKIPKIRGVGFKGKHFSEVFSWGGEEFFKFFDFKPRKLSQHSVLHKPVRQSPSSPPLHPPDHCHHPRHYWTDSIIFCSWPAHSACP